VSRRLLLNVATIRRRIFLYIPVEELRPHCVDVCRRLDEKGSLA
jgi:hypothetical protein